MSDVKVTPAVLERTVRSAQEQIARYRPLRAGLHLDLSDGIFVRGRTIGLTQLRLLRLLKYTSAHLMVQRPERWAAACWNAGIQRLIIHVESDVSSHLLRELRRRFTLVLALRPGTTINDFLKFKEFADGAQVMTVHPGRQGARFIRTQLAVIRALRKRYPRLPLTADGGMNENTIPPAIAAGADEIVVGAALRGRDPRVTYRALVGAAQG